MKKLAATDKLGAAVNHLIENIQNITKSLLDGSDVQTGINNFLEIWLVFTSQVLADPDHVSDVQISYWQDYLTLCEDLHAHLTAAIVPGNPAKNMVLEIFVEKFYMLLSRHLQHLLRSMLDSRKDEKQLESYCFQFAGALAFANKSNCLSAQLN
jgi:hypothetical protein